MGDLLLSTRELKRLAEKDKTRKVYNQMGRVWRRVFNKIAEIERDNEFVEGKNLWVEGASGVGEG